MKHPRMQPDLLERVRAALGEPLLREIGATDLRAYESGDGVLFGFRGVKDRSFVISFDEEADCYHVRLLRKDLSTLQGQRGLPLSGIATAVRRLSQHP